MANAEKQHQEDKGKFFGVVDVKSKFGGLTIN
jgi:hypothetical protein